MIKIIQFDDPFIKWRDLTRVCENAQQLAVRKLIADLRYRKWKVLKRLHLTLAHVEVQLQWALKYQDFIAED